MSKIAERVGYMLENHEAIKVGIFRGEVSKFQLQFNEDTGAASAFGSLKCEKRWKNKKGVEGKEVYYVNFNAFGDVAIGMSITEGDHVTMLTEASRRKGKDGKWYDNNTVILCELVN